MTRRTAGIIAALALWGAAAARAAEPRAVYSSEPTIRFPFNANSSGRVKMAELYVATDQTRGFQFHASATPQDGRFKEYVAPSDGTYLFAVRSIDLNDRPDPQYLDQLQAQMKVVIDSRKPAITLRMPVATAPNVVGVEWDVRDENLDANQIHLEYRVPGQSDWMPHAINGKATGTQYWRTTPNAPKMEVRVSAVDLAKNSAAAIISLPDGQVTGGDAGAAPIGNQPGVVPVNPPRMHYSNSPKIGIPFRLSNVGVSGVPVLDLWVTRDNGRRWEKAPRMALESSPPEGTMPANPGEGGGQFRRFEYAAEGEGQYGFLVVVRSGVGLGDTDPRPGELPKMVIEVDTTRPEVQCEATAGVGTAVRNVTIRWAARDKNLPEKPVTLLYSDRKDGEFKPIINDLDREGRYTWTIGEQGPFQFFVQARAVDKAGNIGLATCEKFITVDLSHPRIELLDPVALPGK